MLALDRLIKWMTVILAVGVLSYGAYYYADTAGIGLGTGEDQTIAGAREMVTLDPENIAARNRLATLYIDKAMYDAAISEMDAVLSASPGQSRSLTIQGLAYFRKGDPDNALQRFQEVIDATADRQFGAFSQDVNNSSYFAGVILLERQEYAAAAEHFRRALVLESADADAHMHLGWALSEMGHTDEALKELSTAANFLPKEAEFHYRYGLGLEKAGRSEDARRELEIAVEQDKDHRAASEALKRLTRS